MIRPLLVFSTLDGESLRHGKKTFPVGFEKLAQAVGIDVKGKQITSKMIDRILNYLSILVDVGNIDSFTENVQDIAR